MAAPSQHQLYGPDGSVHELSASFTEKLPSHLCREAGMSAWNWSLSLLHCFALMIPSLGPTRSTTHAAFFGSLVYLIGAMDTELWQKDGGLYAYNRSRIYGDRDHCSSVSPVLAVCLDLPLRRELLSSRPKFWFLESNVWCTYSALWKNVFLLHVLQDLELLVPLHAAPKHGKKQFLGWSPPHPYKNQRF